MNSLKHLAIFVLSTVPITASSRADSVHAAAWAAGGGDISALNGAYLGSARYTEHDVGASQASARGEVDVPLTAISHAIRSTSSASVDLQFGGGLHLAASSFAGYDGGAQAAAQWVDVIRFASGAVDPPARLELTFHAEGSIANAPDISVWRSTASARVDLDASGNAYDPLATKFPGFTTTAASFFVGRSTLYNEVGELDYFDSSDKDARLENFQLTTFADLSQSFSYDFRQVVAYDPSIDGYNLNLLAILSTHAFGNSSASADLSHTITLSSVGLPGGAALPGPITFDSGFRLTAVPEPASLVTASLGGLAGAAFGSYRRRRPA